MAKRRSLGLYQRDVAKQLGVSVDTVLHWEKDQTQVPDRMWPTIIQFLGYDPFASQDAAPLAERLREWRRVRGLSIKRAAKHVGVNEGTWAKWETGTKPANRRHATVIIKLLGHS